MEIHPQLRALRSDDAPQRLAQAAIYRAMDAWRTLPFVGAVHADLERHAGGAPLEDCGALAALFDGRRTEGADFARTFNAAVARVLDDAPLAHVPFRHFTDGTVSTLLLGAAHDVSLMLVAVDGSALAAAPPPISISLSPALCHEHVLAGMADAELVAATPGANGDARLARRAVRLEPGCVIARDGGQEALIYRRVNGCVVSLRLVRRTASGAAGCEYRLSDGALLHRSAGHVRDSRLELAATLLGRMQRTDAAPLLAAMAREDGADATRWHALRECLGLDTALGFATLRAIADSPADPLAGPARALRARLAGAHPELERLVPCPA